jgi:hypothetical protein
VTPLCIAEIAWLTDVQGHLKLSAKLLQHGIESLGRPVEQVTKTVNIDLILPASKAGVCRMEVLTEHVRMGHPALLFLSVEPLREGLAHGMMTRGWLASVTLHPVAIAIQTLQERLREPQADDAGAAMFFAWHGSLFPVMVC